MAEKTAAAKGRIKPGSRIAIVNRVRGVVESLGLPSDATFVPVPGADLVFLFAPTRAKLESAMPAAVRRMGAAAVMWVFFRKGSKGAGLDMSRNTVWAVADGLGMRPLGLVAIDETWSAFRLRRAAV